MSKIKAKTKISVAVGIALLISFISIFLSPKFVKSQEAVCGNGICEPGEDIYCPEDCFVCGNGICEEPYESVWMCPQDCPGFCGDFFCNIYYGENYATCSQDCTGYCGDGICDPTESYSTCPADCYTRITNCTTITSPGEYRLVNDIIDSSVVACINIQSNNVVLDCQGYTIDGVNSERSPYYIVGINVSGYSNIVIKNCNLKNWYDGVFIGNSTSDTIIGIHGNVSGNMVHVVNSSSISITDVSGLPSVYLEWSNYSVVSYADGDVYLRYSNSNNISDVNGWLDLDNSNKNNIRNVNGYVKLYSSNNNKLSNIKLYDFGLEMYNSSYNTISNGQITNCRTYGIYLDLSSYNNISDIQLNGNNVGIRIEGSDYNTIIRLTIQNSSSYGIHIISSQGNQIYNNIFNNTNNLYFEGAIYTNYWNTTLTYGTIANIVGGPYIGGNYWGSPDGTGYSDTCSDSNYDGICDNPYTLATDNIDYLPLARTPPYIGITNCINITLQGEYRLTQDIIPYTNSCINIQSNNVVLDCQGYTIDGVNVYGTPNTVGINVRGSSNVTIKNCNLKEWYYNIYLDSSSSNNIINITSGISNTNIVLDHNSNSNNLKNIYISSGTRGIVIEYSNFNNLENVTILNSYVAGLVLYGSNYNTIVNVNISKVQRYYGIFLISSNNNIIRDSIVQNTNSYAIYLQNSDSNLIYNNIFNSTNNVGFSGVYHNNWNTTLTSGTNIVGGPYIGGNYWGSPDGTGYSDTCSDSNYDGICDNPYTLATDNIDYLPLAPPPAPPYTEVSSCMQITQPGEYRLVNDLQLTADYPYCLDVFSNDVIIDCQGYKIQDYTGYHSYPDGINIRQNVANVTVKNCDIRGFGGEAGVFLRGNNSIIRIYNTSVIDSKIGIIGDGNDIILDNISTNNVQNPIWFSPINNLKVLNSKINANASFMVNGTNIEIAYNEFRYVNVRVYNDLYLNSSSFHDNTIYAINDNYNGAVRVYFYLGANDTEFYNNVIYATNTSYVTTSNNSLVLILIRYGAYNVSFHDNYGYGKYPNGAAVGISFLSLYAEKIYVYNNYLESTSALCVQATKGINQYIYNNTILDGCIWVIGPVNDVYIYDNKISQFSIGSVNNPINNMYAYNNTIWGNRSTSPGVKIWYADAAYKTKLVGSNIFHPETDTLTPYLSVVLNYSSIDYGTTQPFNSYDYIGGITVNTNMIDYKIEIDSTDLVSGANSISKNNLSFGFNKTLDFNYLLNPYSTITIFKQNIQDIFNILTRLYVPLVPPGTYTGTITITISQGLSDNQIPNPYGGVNVEIQ